MGKNSARASWTKAIGPNDESRSVPEDVARRVWLAAGGRCTFCNKNLVIDEVTGQDVLIGQLAHIVGWSTAPGSPRGDDDLQPDQRSEADNLLLICYDQHHVIDHRSMWEAYDADTLRRMKRQHEGRVRQLTALRDSQRSTVLRIVSSIADVPVELSRRTVARTLLERDLFPDYALLGYDAEIEVDLRRLVGESDGTALYWQSGQAQIAAVGERLCQLVSTGDVHHISILALARIPFLVALGASIGEGLPVGLYPTRRSGSGGFGWTPSIPTARFESSVLHAGNDQANVAVAVSISGSIPVDAVVRELGDGHTVYGLGIGEGRGGPEVLCTQESIDAFARSWRDLLARIESEHPGAEVLSIFPAVPVVAAVVMGRALMRGAHPALRIHDLSHKTRRYEFALEVRR